MSVKNPKPKRVTKRQQSKRQLEYRVDTGSNRASKKLRRKLY